MLDAILLCGRSCAGKTTGGQLLSAALGKPHCEASHYMRRYWQTLGKPGENADDFAFRSLREDVTRVPAAILAECGRDKASLAIVTGLRSPEEVAVMQEACRTSMLVWVDCDATLRFARAQLRDRSDAPRSFDELTAKDAAQNDMGLERLQSELNPIVVSNQGSLAQYQEQLLAVIGLLPPS